MAAQAVLLWPKAQRKLGGMQAAAAGTLAGVGCGGGSGADGAPQDLRNAMFRARGFASSGSPLQGRSPRLRRWEERRGEGAPCLAR